MVTSSAQQAKPAQIQLWNILETKDKTRDMKFNDGWNDYLVEIVETEATKDVILL